MPPKLYTPQTAREVVPFAYETIRRACVSGELVAVKRGNSKRSRWLITEEDLLRWAGLDLEASA